MKQGTVLCIDISWHEIKECAIIIPHLWLAAEAYEDFKDADEHQGGDEIVNPDVILVIAADNAFDRSMRKGGANNHNL